MGLLDAFKKAQKVAEEHPEQVAAGMHKLEAVAEERTGGRFDGQIQAGGEKLEQALGVPKHRGARRPASDGGRHHQH